MQHHLYCNHLQERIIILMKENRIKPKTGNSCLRNWNRIKCFGQIEII